MPYSRFDEDGDDEVLNKRRIKHHKKNPEDPYKMQERFFRYGIRPDWLQIHHVISRQTLKDGTVQFFIKWRELPYQDCSWEDEDMDIPEYEIHKQHYEVRKNVSFLRKLENWNWVFTTKIVERGISETNIQWTLFINNS